MLFKITRIFLLSLSLALLACLPHTTKIAHASTSQISHRRNVFIDANFNEFEENVVMNSLKSWECSTNRLIRFDIKLHYIPIDYFFIDDKPEQLLILKTTGKNKLVSDLDKIQDKGRYTVGVLYPSENGESPFILLAMDRISNDEFKATIKHEIGHSLGLKHSDNKNSIMYKNIDEGAKRITTDDLEQFCKIYHCDADKLTTCN